MPLPDRQTDRRRTRSLSLPGPGSIVFHRVFFVFLVYILSQIVKNRHFARFTRSWVVFWVATLPKKLNEISCAIKNFFFIFSYFSLFNAPLTCLYYCIKSQSYVPTAALSIILIPNAGEKKYMD